MDSLKSRLGTFEETIHDRLEEITTNSEEDKEWNYKRNIKRHRGHRERSSNTLQFHEEITKMKGEIILFKEIMAEKSWNLRREFLLFI